jgi:hypothetical protein
MTSAVAPGAGAEQSGVRHRDVYLFRGIEFAAGCDVGLVQLSLLQLSLHNAGSPAGL